MEVQLKELFENYGLEVSEKQINQFKKFYELLVLWNEKMNLTAITERKEVEIKHFLDSVLTYKFFKGNESVIDIGAGAGFPGIPLKIMFPNLKLTLVDSLNKRVNFLKMLVEELGLADVICVHGRAEDIAKKLEFRENFNVCVARAVARLNVLSEYCLPFVKVDGLFIAYKSLSAKEELTEAAVAIKKLGGAYSDLDSVNLLEIGEVRNNIVIKKVDKTDMKYPRGQNKPRTNPLT